MEKNIISKAVKKFFPRQKVTVIRPIIACSSPHFGLTHYKKVTLVCNKNGSPEFVLKYPKKKSYSKEFKKEFKEFKKFSKKIRGVFPKPIGSFTHNGFFVSVEEGIDGERFVPKKSEFDFWARKIWKINKKIINKSSKKISKKMRALLRKKAKKYVKDKTINKEFKKCLHDSKSIKSTFDWGYGNVIHEAKNLRIIDWESFQEVSEMNPLLSFIDSCLCYLGISPGRKNMESILKRIGVGWDKKVFANVSCYYLMKHDFMKTRDKKYLDFFRLMFLSAK